MSSHIPKRRNCPQCGRQRMIKYFKRNPRTSGGHNPVCMACTKAIAEGKMVKIERHKYSKDEQRVVDYLRVLAPDIGAGADPIGFLIAAYDALLLRSRSLLASSMSSSHYRSPSQALQSPPSTPQPDSSQSRPDPMKTPASPVPSSSPPPAASKRR